MIVAATKWAQHAAYLKAIQAPRDHNKSAQNRQTLTSVDVDNMFAICAQSLRLKGARAQVLFQLELQTGFRGCEVIHARWSEMQMQEADQLCHIGPDAFRAIGIGINQGKTNATGAMRWTGFAQHAYAHYDLAASLGELLACEIYENHLGLIDMMLDRDPGWDSIPILFPENTHNTPEQKVGQATRLMDAVTKQIPGWSKDKRMHLFRKTVTQQLRVHGAEHGDINKHLVWADDVQSRYYTLADLQAGDKPQAILAGFTKVDWHEQHHLGRSIVPLPSTGWLDAVIPRLTEALQEKDALPVRSQETLEWLRMYAEAYWQALPLKGLKHTQEYLNRQVPGVQEVLQTPVYRQFAEQVIRQEADSLQKLGLKAPHLALWTSSTSQSSSAAPASTAEMVCVSSAGACTSMERPAKRKRTEAEIELQARLDDLKSQNRQDELELQIQQELLYQKSLKLQLKYQQQAVAQVNAEQQTWRMPEIWSNAKQPGQMTAALTAETCLPHGVHQITTSAVLPPMHVALSSPEASAKGSKSQVKPAAALCNPVLFTSKTIAGRYREWAADGVYGGSIKNRLTLSWLSATAQTETVF